MTGPGQVVVVDDTSRHGAPARSWWILVGVLALVVAALVVALVQVRAHDGRPRAAAGDVFDHPYQEDPLPHPAEVLLPWARTQVAAAGPYDELPTVGAVEAAVRAPEGGSFVHVEVVVPDDALVPLAATGAPFVSRAEVVLRADGRDYPLSVPGGIALDAADITGRGGGRWVAVDGRPDDLEVFVTVDGVSQLVEAEDGTVAEAGRVGELADLPTDEELVATPSTGCGDPTRLDDSGLRVTYRPGLDCEVSLVLRTPYVDGLGWAEVNRDWVVVQVVRPRRLSLATGRGDASRSWESTLRSSATLGGAEPVTPAVDVNDLGGALSISDPDDPVQLVFDVAGGEPLGDLVLDLVADATLGAPFVTDTREVHLRWTVPGGGLA